MDQRLVLGAGVTWKCEAPAVISPSRWAPDVMWTAVIVLESGRGITVKLQYKCCTSSRGK
jgi:hypothetical protein